MFYRIIVALFVMLNIVDLWHQQYFTQSYYKIKTVLSNRKGMIFIMLILFFIIISIIDIPIAHLAQSHINPARLAIFSKISLLADSLYLVPTLMVLIVCFSKLKQVGDKYNFKLRLSKIIIVLQISITSLLCSGLVNGILKALFTRQRPVVGLNNWSLFSIVFNPDCHLKGISYLYNSLPSGHTVVTVATILPIFWAYPKNIWLMCLLIIWYVVIIFSRIYTLNHWCSDTFLASCVGYMIATICYQGNKYKLIQNES